VRIEFLRGWGPYLAGRVFDLPDPLAAIHVAMGRARVVVEARTQAAPAPKQEPAGAGKASRKR